MENRFVYVTKNIASDNYDIKKYEIGMLRGKKSNHIMKSGNVRFVKNAQSQD